MPTLAQLQPDFLAQSTASSSGQRHQYRYYGMAAWQAQSGNAVVALVNTLGSGKKILVHSVEINNLTRGAAATVLMPLALCRIGSALTSGESLPLGKLDSTASLPSGIALLRNAPCAATEILTRIVSPKQGGSANPTLQAKIGPTGRVGKRPHDALAYHSNWLDSTHEPITLRPGESLALMPNNTALSVASQLMLADVVFAVVGSPTRTYAWSGPIWVHTEGVSPLALVNNSAADVVRVKELRVHECGTLDSPYFRVVPIGGVAPTALADPRAQLPVIKLDTDSPDLTSAVAQLVADAPLLPYGVPEAYLADSSAGAPKGANYLHTKDFVGPMYMGLFPEYTGYGAAPGVASERQLAGFGQRADQVKGFRDPIVIREGEAMGLVSSAELATGTSAVGLSGWSLFEIGLTFSVEPTIIPAITVTGLVSGSDVVILDAGTTTVLAQVDQNAGATWSWDYDADAVSTVDICVYKQTYVPYILRNIYPGSAGITIPVVQVADRNFTA